MKRPISLSIGAILQWAAAAVAVVSGLDLIGAAFAMSRSGVSAQLESTLQAQGITDIAGSLLVIGVFIAGAVLIAVSLFSIIVTAYLWQGRSWARIVTAVLVSLSIVVGVSYLFDGYVMRMLLTVPVDIVVLWLIFREDSSAYVTSRSTARVAERTPAA